MIGRFRSKTFKSLFPYFLLALAIIGAYRLVSEIGILFGFFGRLWIIATPFFYGFLLAYILNIPRGGIQRFLEKSKIRFVVRRKKALSILIVFIVFLLIFASILTWLIPAVVQSIALFISNFPTHYENALQFVRHINDLELFGFYIDTDDINLQIQDMLQNFGPENILSPLNMLINVSSVIFSSLFAGFLTFISSIYILIEQDKFKLFLNRLLRVFASARVYKTIVKYADNLNKNFKRYIFTQTIDGLILGTIVTVQLSIMGSPYALLLGLMLAILNYIPYFGSIFGSLIAIIVVAFTQGMTRGAIAAVVLLITQQIDGNIIQPRLMGGSFSLSPLLIIFSITIGGAFAGILGMIAAIPIVAVLKEVLDSIVAYYEGEKERKAAKLTDAQNLQE